MNIIDRVKDGFGLFNRGVEVVDEGTAVATRESLRAYKDYDDIGEELMARGSVSGGEQDGRDVDFLDKLKEVVRLFRRFQSGPLTRNDALECPTYKRAITLLSNVVAGRLVRAKAKRASRQEVWRRMGVRGFSGMDNKFNFWQDAVANMLIDSYYGEIKHGVMNKDNRNVRIIGRPSSLVLPRLLGDDGDEGIDYLLTTGYDTNGDRVQRKIPWKDMLHLRRVNTKEKYILSTYESGYPTVTGQLKPVPSYCDLELHIKKLMLLDKFERDYWESPASFKMGLIMLTAEANSGRADGYAEDVDILKDIIARLEIKSPLLMGAGANMNMGTSNTPGISAQMENAFKDYDKSIHQLREDIETVIASYFGCNPSDLGSDAARSGTGAEELSESFWRNGVAPVVDACKYEIENKLLGGEELSIPSFQYFVSPATAGKVSQACVGALTVDEYRDMILDTTELGDERGKEIYMGSQTGMGMEGVTDSPNEAGVNMRLVS